MTQPNTPFTPAHGPSDPLPKGVSKPTWVVLDLAGSYPARVPGGPLVQLLQRTETLEAFEAKLEKLAGADWLHGVLFRLGALEVGYTTASALRQAIARLAEKKRTSVYAPRLGMGGLLIGAGAHEITVPESAEIDLRGFGVEFTYLGQFLKKHGVGFENLRIREYKSALTRFSDDGMDPHNREQWEALLASLEGSWTEEVAAARGRTPDEVRAWIGEPITSARAAMARGVVDRVAYEDELFGPATRPWAAVAGYLMPSPPKKVKEKGRVAVVSLQGAIVPGKSRNNPLPLPLTGGPQAGSDSLVAALRRAGRDPQTKAIVFHVDSGGGSALASDLIWREVARSEKPVVAVMGAVAASGGYYVLTHAKRVIASPYTITGSIGVVSGKPVLEEFNARQGLNPERVARQDRALLYSAARPYTEGERALIEREIEEVYDRFTARVAGGRGLTQARVNEIGRGRIWSGADAVGIGLVDELGDLNTATQRACELAGLSYDAPVWHVDPPRRGPLPEFAQAASLGLAGGELNLSALGAALMPPLLGERVLLWLDRNWTLK